MPRKKPPIGKRQLKRMTRERLTKEFTDRGMRVEEQTAGSITYQVVKFSDEDAQVVAAIYGSLNGCASLWMKEAAFAHVRSDLPADTQVEDVEPFRRGFQWAVHFMAPDCDLITPCVNATCKAAKDRLTKTLVRRSEDDRRVVARAEREKHKAETRRDWTVEPDDEIEIVNE